MLDTATYTPRLRTQFRDTIKPALKEEFGYTNDLQIPRLDKIVLNIGCGAEAVRDSKKAKSAVEDLSKIAGQQAVTTKAKKSIAGFRGVKPSFDGRGNFAMGMKEHIVFPEIDFDKVDEVWGMDIIITTTAKTDAEAKALLKHFNMPFNA